MAGFRILPVGPALRNSATSSDRGCGRSRLQVLGRTIWYTDGRNTGTSSGGGEGGRACPRIPGEQKCKKLAEEALAIEAEETRAVGAYA
jgi:hypothetical protein